MTQWSPGGGARSSVYSFDPNPTLPIESLRTRSPRSSRPARWSPSQRELRKYASLFLRTDHNRDGLVEASEAHSLCSRSGLSDGALSQAWKHADEDRRGALNFRQFVLLMHLITSCVRGLEMPSVDQGPPPDLLATLARLVETPEELDGQRSVSPSRSSNSNSSAYSGSPRVDSYSSTARPTAAGQSVQRESSRPQEVPSMRSRQEDSGSDGGSSSPRFGHQRYRPGPPGSFSSRPADTDTICRHLRAVYEADRVLSRQFSREADSFDAATRDARETYIQLDTEMHRKRDDATRLAELRHNLDRQLVYGKRRLSELCESRHEMGQELRSTHHQQSQLEKEQALLKETLEEEERMLRELQSSNQRLEQSCRSLASDIDELKHTRKAVLEQAQTEADLLHRERHRNMEAYGERECVQALPDVHIPPPATPALSEPYSWASSLVGGAIGSPSIAGGRAVLPGDVAEPLSGLFSAAAIGAPRPAMPTLRGRPCNREGV